MSKAMRKLAGVMNRSECTAIFINQLREKIGVMFGNPETTAGGKALKFYASIRIDIRRGEAIKNGVEVIGNKVTVKVVKNKVAPPFKIAIIDIMYGTGISRIGELIDLSVENEIIQKSGSWMSYKGEKIGQGRDAVKAYLEANPVIAETIMGELKSKLLLINEEKRAK
jgi:recombination protein RecA